MQALHFYQYVCIVLGLFTLLPLTNGGSGALSEDSLDVFSSHLGDTSWFRDALDGVSGGPKSRDKRWILELPKGLSFEMKWSLDFPFETFTRYKTSLQLALVMAKKYPAEIIHDTDHPTLQELLEYKYKEDEEYGDYHYLHRRRRAASGTERRAVYSAIETFLSDWGMPGRPCLLRTICEVAEAPFHEDDFLGNALNTILRPSGGDHDAQDYLQLLEAETHGHHNGSCHQRFGHCPQSVFESLPFITHQVTEYQH